MTIVEAARTVTGGIDTHGETHVAAVLDQVGGVSNDGGTASRFGVTDEVPPTAVEEEAGKIPIDQHDLIPVTSTPSPATLTP